MTRKAGLEGEIEGGWSKLTATVDAELTKRNPDSMRAAVKVVTLSGEPTAVGRWDGDDWRPATRGASVSIEVRRTIPLVHLEVQTDVATSVRELSAALAMLAREATMALDELAFTGVPPGDTCIPAVIEPVAVKHLTLAIPLVPDEGRMVLHATGAMGTTNEQQVAKLLGPAKPVHAPSLDAVAEPYVLIASDRVQLLISQDWRLAYRMVDERHARLVLDFVGTFRARPSSAIAFEVIP